MNARQWERAQVDTAYLERVREKGRQHYAKHIARLAAESRVRQKRRYDACYGVDPAYKADLERRRAKFIAKKLATDPVGWKEHLKRYRLQRYAKNPQHFRDYMRQYYAEHREHCRTLANRRYVKNAAKIRQRGREYRQKYRERRQEYYRLNAEHLKTYSREYYRKNWLELKMSRMSKEETEEVSLLCERGCGKKTLSPTGVCHACRTTACRKCQRPMIEKYLGQRVHDKCLPKE